MQAIVGGVSISFDHSDGDAIFVSHAHADHLNGLRNKKPKKLIASDETMLLGGLFGERVSFDGVKTHNAGHILGARQISVEEDGRKSVYTGDICLHENLVLKGAEIIECDRLIIDATYGNPEYSFPAYEETCESIAKWVNENLAHGNNAIIGGYELGKAQELVKIINTLVGCAPIVTEKMAGFCEIYNKFNAGLDFIVVGSDEAEEIMKKPFVAIVPMRHAKRYFAERLSEAFGRKTVSAVATGWALKYRFNADAAFPLSDHADFKDLKRYIDESGAKEIEFFQGDGKALKKGMKIIVTYK